MLRPSPPVQALKAQKLLIALQHARIRCLQHHFHNWKQCHATWQEDHADRMLLALQFMTGQSLGEAVRSCQCFACRYEPFVITFVKSGNVMRTSHTESSCMMQLWHLTLGEFTQTISLLSVRSWPMSVLC